MHAARFRRTTCALGATLLLALAAVTFAQSSGSASPAYAIGAADSAGEASFESTLAISGEWPTQCPPTLEKVTLDGADLRIDARSVLGLCTRRPMPFKIEVNPALAMDRASIAAGIYHVSFYAADGAQAQPQLRAFALLDRSAAGTAAIAPETGFWWTANSSESGASRTVLSIELQNEQLSVALMSYDSIGQPEWHFGAAPYSGHIAHVPLLRLAGGSDPFSPANAASPHGESMLTLDLQFHSSAHASAWLSRMAGSADDSSLQLRTFDLARLPLTEVADGRVWQGDWVLVDDGEAQPQRLHFDRFHAIGATRFQIEDSAGAAVLVCARDATHPELPPTACSLRLPNRTDSFESVAISRMDGARADGTAIHLLRISH